MTRGRSSAGNEHLGIRRLAPLFVAAGLVAFESACAGPGDMATAPPLETVTVTVTAPSTVTVTAPSTGPCQVSVWPPPVGGNCNPSATKTCSPGDPGYPNNCV